MLETIPPRGRSGQKGQFFMVDLFTAYTGLIIIVFLGSLFAVFVLDFAAEKTQTDKFHRIVLSSTDYLVYSSEYTTTMYAFNTTAIDAFFALDDTQIRNKFNFEELNYTIVLEQIDGTVLKQVGSFPADISQAVGIKRFVTYQEDMIIMRFIVWEN